VSMRNPNTGKSASKIRVWFTASGSSPNVPFFEKTRYEERYIAVPDELLGEEERWSISTEEGETFEP
jgi:hypothetical protein